MPWRSLSAVQLFRAASNQISTLSKNLCKLFAWAGARPRSSSNTLHLSPFRIHFLWGNFTHASLSPSRVSNQPFRSWYRCELLYSVSAWIRQEWCVSMLQSHSLSALPILCAIQVIRHKSGRYGGGQATLTAPSWICALPTIKRPS